MSKELIGSHSVHETLVRQTQIDAARIEELERKVASRDAEVAKLKDDNEYLYVAAIERDQLREQVKVLRDALPQLEQQLTEYQAALALKDEALKESLRWIPDDFIAAGVAQALAIKP